MSHYSCPECQGTTTVIETRLSNSRLRRRRKCIKEGHRFSTIEVPLDTAQRMTELVKWLTQHIGPELAEYAHEQVGAIMLGNSIDD